MTMVGVDDIPINRRENLAKIQENLCQDEAIDDAWAFDIVENNPQAGLAVALVGVNVVQRIDENTRTSMILKARQNLQKASQKLRVEDYLHGISLRNFQWLVLTQIPRSAAGVVDEYTLRRYLQTEQHGGRRGLRAPVAEQQSYADSDAHQYWERQLRDAKPPKFPRINPSGLSKQLTSSNMEQASSRVALPQPGYSFASRDNILRAAWAVLLGRYSDSNDICFGTQILDFQKIDPGPAKVPVSVATVPLRIHIDQTSTVKSFLRMVQMQVSKMKPYQRLGIRNISMVNSEAKEVCVFSSMLTVQSEDLVQITAAPTIATLDHAQGDSEVPLNDRIAAPLALHCILLDDAVDLHVMYDSHVLAKIQVVGILKHFHQLLQQFGSPDEMILGELALEGPWDLQQAFNWNHENVPEIVDSCIHLSIASQVKSCPDAVAIDSWDGRLTYYALETAANRLAHHLIAAGIKCESLVLVCFEKSMWYYVAILAINKAGGAW